jgi:dienelactone hydrolase
MVAWVPVKDESRQRVEAKLETRIFKPAGDGPFPVAILNHGSAGGNPKATITWDNETEYLVGKGYAVLAPMRRGRGKSSGHSLESEDKNCDVQSWIPGVTASMRDISAVIEFSRTLPFADSHRILLLGVSRGGFLSVAYAAEGQYRDDVRQVINFVGGWVAQAEDRCPTDFNTHSFEKYGAETHVPMLWLYGANDRFYGDESIQTYFRTF